MLTHSWREKPRNTDRGASTLTIADREKNRVSQAME
jgi:hypothetical protein